MSSGFPQLEKIDHAAAKKKINDIITLQMTKESDMMNVRKQNFIDDLSNPTSTKNQREIDHPEFVGITRTITNPILEEQPPNLITDFNCKELTKEFFPASVNLLPSSKN